MVAFVLLFDDEVQTVPQAQDLLAFIAGILQLTDCMIARFYQP